MKICGRYIIVAGRKLTLSAFTRKQTWVAYSITFDQLYTFHYGTESFMLYLIDDDLIPLGIL